MNNFLVSRDKCPGSLCHSPSVGIRVGVCAWTKTLTLAITFLPEVIGLSYCTCVFLVTRPFTWYHNFWPHDLDLEVWPTLDKNFNLGHNSLTRSDRAFILHMCIPCDKTFHMVPYFLTLWPSSLTYFWKTLTLAITFSCFLSEDIGLSYCTYVYLVTRSFIWYHNFWPRDFVLEVWPTFEKL